MVKLPLFERELQVDQPWMNGDGSDVYHVYRTYIRRLRLLSKAGTKI